MLELAGRTLVKVLGSDHVGNDLTCVFELHIYRAKCIYRYISAYICSRWHTYWKLYGIYIIYVSKYVYIYIYYIYTHAVVHIHIICCIRDMLFLYSRSLELGDD